MSLSSHEVWPKVVFMPPILRGLSERDQVALAQAGTILSVKKGKQVFVPGQDADSFFVVISGRIQLQAVKRGDDQLSVIRTVGRGDLFGEEAALHSHHRHWEAVASEVSEIAEIPVVVFRRAVVRSGVEQGAERELRWLQRTAMRDLLQTMAFTRSLPEEEIDHVLDSLTIKSFVRSERIYTYGDRAEDCYLLADGLVQLQVEDESESYVQAYLRTGDFFGEEELLRGENRPLTAVSMGHTRLVCMPSKVFRGLSDRHPGLVKRLRRIASQRAEHQQEVVQELEQRSTQHVFKDLYRMQMARSMLVIDQNSCVRCGHCSWTCSELYGVSRLVRRGDKIVTKLAIVADPQEKMKSLSLPNSCQHCKNPLCMLDCPTGAIGRDPKGEVFIRENLCTGCGNCAKGCPWGNIQMAPRTASSAPIQIASDGYRVTLSEEVAVKCELCPTFEEPACVQSCPTSAIVRVEPMQDFEELRDLLGLPQVKNEAISYAWMKSWLGPSALAVASVMSAYGWLHHRDGSWVAGHGVGYSSGLAAAATVIFLATYVVPKRWPRLWMKSKSPSQKAALTMQDSRIPGSQARSRVRPWFLAHVGAGLVVVGLVFAHTGGKIPNNVAGTLALAFWLCVLFGFFGAWVYRWLPERLSRLERSTVLPEEIAQENEYLLDKLYATTSGSNELIKKIVEKVISPYLKSWLGPVSLVLAGRSLKQEESHLQNIISNMLQGRGADKLAQLPGILRIVVEIRALPARRWMTFALRFWHWPHWILAGITGTLVLVHILSVVRY
jgi:Fe-S-cluster-containing dehydrogenase component